MKILLVDDHILFAKSLSIALCDNPEIEQFSSTKDIQNLEKQIATELPDILLIDINLGGLTDEDGLMLTQHLLERFPDQKIVILSGYNLPVYRKEAKRIGARGFISKDVEPDELLHILLTIKDGATHFPREEVFIEELQTGREKFSNWLHQALGAAKSLNSFLLVNEQYQIICNIFLKNCKLALPLR